MLTKKNDPRSSLFPTGSTGLLITFILCSLLSTADTFAGDIRVKTEIEVLKESGFRMLQGKRVGLITNPTGVDNNLKSTIDILHEAPNVQLVALYGPEHGVRGDVHAGDKVSDFKDPHTGVPVYSLYGATRKPTKEMLEGVDLLVYDIQDIGCRSYTYISTLYLVMQAAAENNIELVVLDRPNPLGGIKVEGNLVEEGFFSFVSQLKIPYVYGLTCGELRYISIGVGYTLPFELFAAGWINAEVFARALNAERFPGITFRPVHLKPYYSVGQEKITREYRSTSPTSTKHACRIFSSM